MNPTPLFQWAVIGAGPAGIAAVGKLLDNNIPAKSILWIDPQFKVGDLGQFWRNVSSNTSVERFTDFLNAADSFQYSKASHDFPLSELPPENTCKLAEVVHPLQWVTDHLRETVVAEMTSIHKIHLAERQWHLFSEAHVYQAQNVILATGSKALGLENNQLETIPFEIAIDQEKLNTVINKEDRVAVYGSSHSAVIILRHLVEAGVKNIINFYRSPCRYAVNMGDWTLFDNTGLKGDTAAWAREHLDGNLPANLQRYNTHDHKPDKLLAECNKVIYAIGFEKRNTLLINDYGNVQHNPNLGIIGPGLFGLGIAYPEIKADPFGHVESQVGLWKFMVYLNKILPVWMKYHC